MLSTNHNRSNNVTINRRNNDDITIESTKYAGSNVGRESNLSEIERKFQKQKKNWAVQNKMYKEDEDLAENYLEKEFQN